MAWRGGRRALLRAVHACPRAVCASLRVLQKCVLSQVVVEALLELSTLVSGFLASGQLRSRWQVGGGTEARARLEEAQRLSLLVLQRRELVAKPSHRLLEAFRH